MVPSPQAAPFCPGATWSHTFVTKSSVDNPASKVEHKFAEAFV